MFTAYNSNVLVSKLNTCEVHLSIVDPRLFAQLTQDWKETRYHNASKIDFVSLLASFL